MGFKQDLQRFPHENCKFWGMPRFGVANPGVSDWFQPRCFSDIVTAINAETDSEDWKRGKFSGIPIEKKDILNAFMIIIYGYGYYGSTLWSPWIVKFRPITEVTSMVPPLAADTASVTHHVYPRRKKQRKARCSSCARLRVCMYIHIWSYMHIYIFVFVRTYVYIYIYVSMYICIYPHNSGRVHIHEHQLFCSGGEGSDAVRKTSSKAEEEGTIHLFTGRFSSKNRGSTSNNAGFTIENWDFTISPVGLSWFNRSEWGYV